MTPRLRSLVFAAVFCLTGVGTALLGATLPATLHEWHLSDAGGGALLLAAWGGSTAGAVFARGTTGKSAIAGVLLAAAGLLSPGLLNGAVLPLCFLLYGLGLGMTMTAISLRRAHEVTPAKADVELNRLNLLWALGACFAPALAFHSLRLLSVVWLFRWLSIVFCVAAALLCAALYGSAGPTVFPSGVGRSGDTTFPWAPLRFCLFAAASVGLESAIGSWLTTYAERSTRGLEAAVSANATFWAGLLLSRALHATNGARPVHTRPFRALHVALAGLALVLLLCRPTPLLLPVAGFVCGFGLGPLYPFVLSVALPRYRSTAVFVSAGVGASVVPWATGALSSAYGTLRVGLWAPITAFVLLAAAAVHMRSELG